MRVEKDSPAVLIVDDEQGVLDALEDLLEDDFPVFTTTDPTCALTVLEEREIGVVLSDQRMPGMPGHEFLSRVSTNSLATRLLLTGYTDMNALVNAVNRSQIFAYVAKPWEPSHLKSLIGTAMEHYRLVEELHSEKYLMESMMNTVPDPIVFVGARERLIRANKAAYELLGMMPDETIEGMDVGALVDGEPSRRAILQADSVSERVVRQVIAPTGEARWYSILRVPFGTQGGTITVAHDVTERHKFELTLAQQAHKLDQSIRELQQFAHVTAHHLQEPLRDVVSHLQMLCHRMQLSEEDNEILEFAVGGAMRMKALFLDFVRYIDFGEERMRLESLCLRSLAERAVAGKLEELELESSTVRIEGEFPEIKGDRSFLHFLFRELLNNSAKFRGERPLEFFVRGEQFDDQWQICVSDRGIGVDSGEEERIFGLFQRLHASDQFPGTGLGLAICRKVVAAHGGRVWVESNLPTPGITVYVSLPKSRVLSCPEVVGRDLSYSALG